jgi:flagellar hook-basal body complex protein FliE
MIMIDPIPPIDGHSSQLSYLRPTSQDSITGGFGAWFSGEIATVNDKLIRAEAETQKLAMGKADNLHEVMIRLEEARLSFQLLAQVRNRLLEAYQEAMRMQI